jgi:hypothetical protein
MGRKAAILVRSQRQLPWLWGTVGDNTISNSELVAIGGGKDEVRRAGEFC